MLLANSFDSSSLFVDKELDSAVESIRPFISVSQKETTTFLQQVFFFNCLDIEDVNKVLRSPTTHVHYIHTYF